MTAAVARSAPRASLVVPVYRGWDHAAALLEPVTGERRPAGLEILVVDDASGDGGAEGLAARFPDVEVVVRGRNGGFAAAVNTGVEASSGAAIVVANSDLEIAPDALETLIVAVERVPGVIAGPRTTRRSGEEIAVAHGRFPTPTGDAVELFLPLRLARRVLRRARRRESRDAERCDWLVGSCLAFSRELWRRVGPLDESFGMYSEEVDWQRRAAALGFRALYLPAAVVTHDETHGADDSSREADRRFAAIWSSRLVYHARWSGRGAELELRVLWVAGFAVSAPGWLAAAAVPRLRRRAVAELRRSTALARAAFRP